MHEPLPKVVEAFLASTFSRKGDLVAWWRNTGGEHCCLVAFEKVPVLRFELSCFPDSMAAWGHQLNGYTLDLASVEKAVSSDSGFFGADWGKMTEVVQQIKDYLARGSGLIVTDELPNGTSVWMLDADVFEDRFLYLPDVVTASQWKSMTARATEESVELSRTSSHGSELRLTPAAGLVVWDCCRAECARASLRMSDRDTFFSDLEASGPDWNSLAPAALPAWNAFAALGGVTACDPSRLPWWLAGAQQAQEAYCGIISPVEAKLIFNHNAAFRALFDESPLKSDATALLDFIEKAASMRCYCVAWSR